MRTQSSVFIGSFLLSSFMVSACGNEAAFRVVGNSELRLADGTSARFEFPQATRLDNGGSLSGQCTITQNDGYDFALDLSQQASGTEPSSRLSITHTGRGNAEFTFRLDYPDLSEIYSANCPVDQILVRAEGSFRLDLSRCELRTPGGRTADLSVNLEGSGCTVLSGPAI